MAVLLPALILPLSAQDAHKHGPPNMDIRVNPPAPLSANLGGSSAAIKSAQTSLSKTLSKGVAALQARIPGLETKLSATTGAVEVVSSPQPLTEAAPGRSGIDIVKDFIAANADLYGLTQADIAGLRFIGESVSSGSGLRMVRVEQTVNGIPVFQSETRFILDKDGRLIRSLGQMVPNATGTAAAADARIAAPAALATAMASVDITLNVGAMSLSDTSPDGRKTQVVANNPAISGTVASRLVYFPLAPGVLVPAWSQTAMTNTADGDYYTIVDANGGQLLWRKNIRAHLSTQEARFSVYVQADGKTPADSPAPLSPSTATPGSNTQPPSIARTTVNMSAAQNPTASPNGWISDGGTTTTGNNVDAYLDANSDNVADPGSLDNNGRPVGNVDVNARNRDFFGTGYAYDPPPSGGNPEAGTAFSDTQFKRGIVTHLFYLTNWYHDQLYSLGFDEAAGNFQSLNFTGQGLGADPVLAEAQDAVANAVAADGSNRNNANFSTPEDGLSGRMQMYIFTGPTVMRDGSLDAEIVLHELTHGLSNRLIGNGSGLIWDIGGGMGEGWSDFYALSLLNNTNADNPNGKYASGAYATYKLAGNTDNYLYGIRRFPYCTDNAVNPLTWADADDVTYSLTGGIAASPVNFSFAGADEVHNIGEIWALTLWEVRSRVIADPAGANGDVPTGNNKMLQLVTDALKMTPASPSLVDARDAIIAADMATNGGANEKWIWQGFADRGLGYNAVAPWSRLYGYISGHISIGESFEVPYLDVQSVTTDDSIGNSSGGIDPGEPVKIGVALKNPWRGSAMLVAGATATLSSTTPGVVITDGTSTYGAIPPLGAITGDTFQFTAPAGAVAGQALDFTITVTSSLLGTKAVNFKLRVGTSAGNGVPLTYTKASALAILDRTPRGTFNTLSITDDFEIADIDFRVDSLTHTFPGDLSVLLRGPTGLGTDLISVIGGGVNAGDGDNLTNTVVDDAAAGNFLLAPNASAPYTGSWKPVFNLPSWTSFGWPAADPVGSLSRYNGLSTQGSWTVLISDQATGDTGTLNSWSLVVTPKAFSTATYTPPEIQVEDGLANDVPDNATRGYGNVAVGSSVSVPYTIKNTGTSGALTGLTYTIDGADPGMFSVTSAPVSPVAAGGSTTITITFQPTSLGGKSASIHIDNNDPDENPFDINFTGTGACPTITVTSPGVSTGAQGTAFSQTFTQTGGVGATTFSKTGSLPAGINLAANGVLSGTPAQAGSFPIVVTATDSLGCTGNSAIYTLVISPAVVAGTPGRFSEGSNASNDTPATASAVALTNGFVKISGNIFPATDVDYYAFQATAGDRVYAATMTSASAGNSTDSQLTLLASDGTTVIEFDDDSGVMATLSSSIAGAVIPSTGTYYLKVNDFTAATGMEKGYDLYLQVRSGSPTPETEPNDTPGSPNPGVNTYWVSGARSPASATEQDWYPITLNAGDTVFLSLDLDPEDDLVVWNGRLGFALFGDATNQILPADDAGTSDTGSTPPTTNRPSEAMFMTVKNAGTYFAFVDSATAATGGPTATYHLNISVLPAIAETWTKYTSSDVPKTLGPTNSLTSSTITIPGHPRIKKIRVNLDLNHVLMTELDVHLRSPAGNDSGLFTDVGSNALNGQAQMDVTLSDDAALIPFYTAVKGMMYKPELAYRLSWFNGEDAGGTWTLDLRDDVNNANGGTLNNWSIEIVEEPTPASGTTIFATDFESGAAGFTHSGTIDEWELGLPATVATTTANPPPLAAFNTANSGVNCWKTDLDGSYELNSNQNLDSPNISLVGVTGTIRLDWAQRYQMENASFDHAYVEVREVGGAGLTRKVWEWLDATMTDSPGNPAVNIGTTAGWANMHADISEFAGKTIQVRFHLDSDNTVVMSGLAIDDVAVISVPTESADPVPLASTLGDVVSDAGANNTAGTASIGSFDLLRRGGAMAENSEIVFPGYLLVGSGAPAVTTNDFQGMWKAADGTIKLLARSGSAAPGTTGAVFDILPEVPAITSNGYATFYASLRVGEGDATAANDTGVWSQGVGSPVGLVMRENDAVTGIAGAFIDHFATGVFATAFPAANTFRAGFPVTLRGSATNTAMLVYEKVGAAAASVSVVAQEGTVAPGAGGETFGYLASGYSDPARMDSQGNLTFAAVLQPSYKRGIFYLKRGAAEVLQKVFITGETAPDTSGATFSYFDTPAKGANGSLAFHGYLNQNGDNSANLKNDGIWYGSITDGFTCVIRRGDAGVAGLPGGAKVGNLWSGWLNSDNQLCLRGWVDVNGDGTSAAPGDVHGIFTNAPGAMTLIVKVGDEAPDVPGATFTEMDLPVNGPGGYTAFIGRITGGGVTSATDVGIWRNLSGTTSLVLRTGDSIVTTQGTKVVQKIDFPGTSQGGFVTDHRWEQPVMDNSGAMILNVTFTDGSTSQVFAP